jgi:hypothetical protein
MNIFHRIQVLVPAETTRLPPVDGTGRLRGQTDVLVTNRNWAQAVGPTRRAEAATTDVVDGEKYS